MKLKIVSGLLLIFLFAKNIEAQDSLATEYLSLERPRFFVTFTPSAWIHPRLPATQIGLEFFFEEKFSVVQDIAYIHFNTRRRPNQRGFKSQSEIRFYPYTYKPNKSNLYIGLQFRYWKFEYNADDFFCRFNCLYQQRLDYKVKQVSSGVNFTIGQHFPLSERLTMDYGVAMGQATRRSTPNLPDDAQALNNRFILFGRQDSDFFDVGELVFLSWVKFGYSF